MDGKENAAFDLEAQYIPKAGEDLHVESISIDSPQEQVTNFDAELNTAENIVEETAVDEIKEEEESNDGFDEENRRFFLVKVCLLGKFSVFFFKLKRKFVFKWVFWPE